MCGRMTLGKEDLGEVATALQASISAEFVADWKPRHNVAPTQKHPILRLEDDARWLRPARWGFRRPDDKTLLINARSETAKHLPAFREAYAARRCLVPADGFYEWGARGAKTKGTPPTWFHAPNGGLLLFAGLWQLGAEGEPVFTVLTTTLNRVVSTAHDRMPVIVAPSDVEEWLRAGGGRFFAPAPDRVLATRLVSTRANGTKNDDLACIAPAPPPALTLDL